MQREGAGTMTYERFMGNTDASGNPQDDEAKLLPQVGRARSEFPPAGGGLGKEDQQEDGNNHRRNSHPTKPTDRNLSPGHSATATNRNLSPASDFVARGRNGSSPGNQQLTVGKAQRTKMASIMLGGDTLVEPPPQAATLSTTPPDGNVALSRSTSPSPSRAVEALKNQLGTNPRSSSPGNGKIQASPRRQHCGNIFQITACIRDAVMNYKPYGEHHAVLQKLGDQEKVWDVLFHAADKDETDKITFEKLDNAVRNVYKANVSRYESRLFWKHVDAEGVTRVTREQLNRNMYKVELKLWPDLSAEELEEVCFYLNKQMDKWYKISGNWYKMFCMMKNNVPDRDSDSDTIVYSDFVRVLRKNLLVPKDKLPEHTLRGLWKAMDKDANIYVKRNTFVAFMRKHLTKHGVTFHKPAAEHAPLEGTWAAAMKQRANNTMLDPPPEMSKERLLEVVRTIESLLKRYYLSKSLRPTDLWEKTWELIDTVGLQKLGLMELTAGLCERLQDKYEGLPKIMLGNHVLFANITFDDLRGVFLKAAQSREGTKNKERAETEDGRAVVTAKEWRVGLYRIELDTWPDADSEVLSDTIEIINWYFSNTHFTDNNWYKLFNIIDTEIYKTGGEIHYDALHKAVYGKHLPCLGIPMDKIPSGSLKMLWKAIDEDRGGTVSYPEFMKFMRRQSKAGYPEQSTKVPPRLAYGTGKSQTAMSAKIDWQTHEWKRVAGQTDSPLTASAGFVNGGQEHFLSRYEAQVLRQNFEVLTIDKIMRAYAAWGYTWSGSIPEWDFHTIVRHLLHIEESEVDDDALAAAWNFLDREGEGQVEARELLERCGFVDAAVNERPPKPKSVVDGMKQRLVWKHTGKGCANQAIRATSNVGPRPSPSPYEHSPLPHA